VNWKKKWKKLLSVLVNDGYSLGPLETPGIEGDIQAAMKKAQAARDRDWVDRMAGAGDGIDGEYHGRPYWVDATGRVHYVENEGVP